MQRRRVACRTVRPGCSPSARSPRAPHRASGGSGAGRAVGGARLGVVPRDAARGTLEVVNGVGGVPMADQRKKRPK